MARNAASRYVGKWPVAAKTVDKSSTMFSEIMKFAQSPPAHRSANK
jgi:hypothetical protein